MKLYIIGNGFDIAHNLKTSYWNFRCYLEKYAENFLTDFEKLYGNYPFDPDEYHIPKEKQKAIIERRNNALYDKLWKTFEDSIGKPDENEFDSICDSTIDDMSYLESGPIGIEDTLNYYFEEQFGFVLELQDYLLKWAKQIRLNKALVKKNELKNNKTDYFLTFNYTPTLERIYSIGSKQICHVHGGIPPYCSIRPIIGHGNNKSIEQWEKWKDENDEVYDEGGSSKCRAIANFYSRTYKDVNKYLERYSDFFIRLKGISEVIVIGHSLGDVDMPYFKKIVEVIGKDIPWTILYYREDEKADLEKKACMLGVKSINMLKSDDFWDA